jgi:hypothetical protein
MIRRDLRHERAGVTAALSAASTGSSTGSARTGCHGRDRTETRRSDDAANPLVTSL